MGGGRGGEERGRQIDVRPLLNGNTLEISENLNAENCLWRSVRPRAEGVRTVRRSDGRQNRTGDLTKSSLSAPQ